MKCPKCKKIFNNGVNFCSQCGNELFQYKNIIKKSAKNIGIEDFINSFGMVFGKYEMTNWIYKSIMFCFHTLRGYYPIAEELFGSKDKSFEMQFAIVDMGYHFRLMETLLTEEETDYSGIQVKKIDDFDKTEGWITFTSYARILTEGDVEDKENNILIDRCSSLIKIDENVSIEAEKKLIDIILVPMFEDNVKNVEVSRNNEDHIAGMVDYLFRFGYWLRFFEDVYNYSNKK